MTPDAFTDDDGPSREPMHHRRTLRRPRKQHAPSTGMVALPEMSDRQVAHWVAGHEAAANRERKRAEAIARALTHLQEHYDRRRGA